MSNRYNGSLIGLKNPKQNSSDRTHMGIYSLNFVHNRQADSDGWSGDNTPVFDPAPFGGNLDNFSPAISTAVHYDISNWKGATWDATNNGASLTPTIYSLSDASAATAFASNNVSVTGATGTTGTAVKFRNPRRGRFSHDGKYLFVSYSTLSSSNFGGIVRRPCFAPYSIPWDTNQKTSAEMEALIDQVLFLESDDGTASDPQDFMFSPDGTKLIFLDYNHNDLRSYTLSTGFDLSTASEDATTVDASNGDTTTAKGLDVNKEGTKIWVFSSGSVVHQLTLSTGGDLSTASHTHNLVLENGSGAAIDSGSPAGIFWAASDYTSFWFRGSSNASFHKYTLTTAWDLSSVSNSNATATHSVSRGTPSTSGMAGNHYATVAPGHYITEMITDTLVGINSSGGVNNTVQSEHGQGYSACFNGDGSRIFLWDRQYDEISEYQLSTAYDISDIGPSASGRVDYAVSGTDGYQIQFDETNGDKIWFLNRSQDRLYIIPLNNGSLSGAAAFSTSTNTYLDVSGADATPRTFHVAKDYVYVIGDTNDTLMRAPLSTSWDITTAGTFTSGYNFSTQNSLGLIASMWISDDGLTMYIADDSPADLIAKYTFGSAWDHTNLTQNWSLPGSQNINSLSNLGPSTQILGFQFNAAGTHLIIYDNLEGVRHWAIQEDQTFSNQGVNVAGKY